MSIKKHLIRCSLAALLINSGVMAEESSPQAEFQQGESLQGDRYAPSYNAPAAIAVKQGEEVDLFINAAFLYWCAYEEGLDLASSGALVELPSLIFSNVLTDNGRFLDQSFSYKPGFKVGLGLDVNNWTLAAEYTWIRQKTQVSQGAPSTDFGAPIWMSNNWFEQLSSSGQSLAATHIQSNWHLEMDLVDVGLGRSYYQGRNVTITPFGGLRAAFIRQNLKIAFTEAPNTYPPAILPSQPIFSKNHSSSWGIGPRAGVEGNWLFCKGFRLQGDVAASLLFTQYQVSHSEDAANINITPSTIKLNISDYNCLRPNIDLGIGLGWGSYLCDQNYHLDISAMYDFSYFWSQNMMRKMMDEFASSIGASAADLELHGLTLNVRFDF